MHRFLQIVCLDELRGTTKNFNKTEDCFPGLESWVSRFLGSGYMHCPAMRLYTSPQFVLKYWSLCIVTVLNVMVQRFLQPTGSNEMVACILRPR
jgi:hypothetical protein